MKKYLLLLILAFALFVRVYRVGDLLGFYYDQGRDALAVWDLIHKGNFFLIGPTTGIEGIFLGPFYYYLITPAYWLGGGNPVWPAVFLALVNVAGIYVIYRIGKDYFDHQTGLIAAFLISISFNLVRAHRWLSNPTPLPVFAALAVYSIFKITSGKNSWWWILGLTLGLSLQLEAASAVFFLPTTLIILLAKRKSIHWNIKSLVLAGSFFILTLLPQFIFDLRNQHLLLGAFQKFLVGEKSFRPTFSGVVIPRLQFYWQIFTDKLVVDAKMTKLVATLLLGSVLIFGRRLPWKKLSILFMWWLIPAAFLMFYHGNNGYVWDYYFTGVYPILLLVVAVVLTSAWRNASWSKLLVILILGIVISENIPRLRYYLTTGVLDGENITLGPSLAAVDWVYEHAPENFNTDVYVPPVIPYAYDYLFLWRGVSKYRHLPSVELRPALFTVYEIDPPHPERLDAWLKRQQGYGNVESEIQFGGITAQQRIRI